MTAQKRAKSADYIRGAPASFPTAENSRVMVGALQEWWIMAAAWQQEAMNFASKRLLKDSKTMRDMMDCKNTADAMEVHSQWMQETLHDYATESTKLLGLAIKRVTESEAHLANGHESPVLRRAAHEAAARMPAE
ncbi:phasin family protein [Microvirga flavescens]|uniref:phasin family protein n=1 Tax=Microvirga flavescens TaxID=2249811 RepID=UPI000DD8C3EC|nr:phasin family protein [Microvirga flavescens]